MILKKKTELLIELLERNQIILSNLTDLKQNFAELLDYNACICYKNCKNLNIIIKSKINRLIFINCNNIKLLVAGLISGIEFKNCTNVNMKSKSDSSINCILISKSTGININFSKKFSKNIFYEIDASRGIKIKDLKNKSILSHY